MESAMSKDSDAGTANDSSAPQVTGDGRTAKIGAPAGIPAGPGGKPSPATRDSVGTSSADGDVPVDLDAAHDRAS
jgi:hypothetical protein